MSTRILFVIDGPVHASDDVTDELGTVFATLNSNWAIVDRYTVDVAVRAATGGRSLRPRYRNFRFDARDEFGFILDRYHEIWCFAEAPSPGRWSEYQADADALAPSRSELQTLSGWMSRPNHGVFATSVFGGASMCHRMPRVGTMLRWTQSWEEEGDRVSTSGASEPGTGDDAQVIVPVPIWDGGRSGPHSVLQFLSGAGIDRMPRARTELLCREPHEIDLNAINQYTRNTFRRVYEYPRAADRRRPQPAVIAYGQATDPPGQRFPMISVYDGRPLNAGRIVVHSTAEHMFDTNVAGIRSAGGENWRKIQQYYRNVAAWLSDGEPLTVNFPR